METKQKIVSEREEQLDAYVESQKLRSKAIEWSKSLLPANQDLLMMKYHPETGRDFSDLTGREIEEIYVREVLVNEHNSKLNQKQFTQFSEELFDKYCMKFSEKDRLQLAEIAINNCKMSFDDSAKIIEIIRKYR